MTRRRQSRVRRARNMLRRHGWNFDGWSPSDLLNGARFARRWRDRRFAHERFAPERFNGDADPYVCPGCYMVGGKCAPGCDEEEFERRLAGTDWDGDWDLDRDDDDEYAEEPGHGGACGCRQCCPDAEQWI